MSAPEPLVPPEVDLTGFRFMPLDTVRLLDSDLFAISTGDEFKAAVSLWCKAWLQKPAGSLPNDDRVLSHLSMTKRWGKVKKVAMRGFVLCSDGRWYHPVIADKVLEAWQRREDWQEAQDNKLTRQQRWRQRLKEISERLRDLGVTVPAGAKLETLERLLADAESSTATSTHASTSPSTVDASETGKTGTGTGTGTGTKSKEDDRPAWLPPEWDEYERHRREKRQSYTPTARSAAIRKLDSWRRKGHDIVAILRYSIDNSYTGLFEPKSNGMQRAGTREDGRALAFRSLSTTPPPRPGEESIDGQATRVE